MNAPERFLSWRWENEDDENRLTYQPDTRLPNAATFVLGKEDHTIGNLMRIQLLRDPSVRFAGYRVPHPLVFDVHIKVETMDHSTTPIKVFETALEDLSVEVDILTRKFDTALEHVE